MAQDFDFKIEGENVPTESARLIRTMDTAADGFSVDVVITQKNEPELYEKIRPYRYTPVTVSLEGELQLTGALTKPTRSKSKSNIITTLNGFSITFNFIDSDIAKTYQFNGLQRLHDIAIQLAKATATKVEFATESGGSFNSPTARRGQSAFEFLAPMARKRSQVMSCTPQGALLFNIANTTGQTVGVIEEDNPDSLLQKEFSVSFDGRKRFKTYKVINQSPFGASNALSSDDNIKQPRHKVVQTDDVAGQAQEIADFQKNRTIIDALTMSIPIVGWNAPDGSLLIPNTLITIKSETMFVPDGFTFIIRQVEYIFEKNNKSSVISIIPPNAYTENTVVEPWFE